MDSHIVAVKWIFRYLNVTMNDIIHFKSRKFSLQAYSDADQVGDPNDHRSTSGYIVYLGTSPISWASTKQHIVSRSSTEAEYKALAIIAAEMAWIQQLLCDLQVLLYAPPTLYYNNISVIALSSNPFFTLG